MRRLTQHRSRREATGQHAHASPKPTSRILHHQLYGDIPMVPTSYTDATGGRRAGLDYDPDYRPPLPRGAVRGDVRKQRFCHMCHVPKYFYLDRRRTCVECRQPFVFSAKEQKYWYERLQFHFSSEAIRCPGCRRRQRAAAALRGKLASIRAALRHDPDDVRALVALAETTVHYRKAFAQGNLDSAISAARRALELSPGDSEAVFWEAACHALAGRVGKARELIVQSGRGTPRKRAQRELLRELLSDRATGARSGEGD